MVNFQIKKKVKGLNIKENVAIVKNQNNDCRRKQVERING
jgi:hypothetical protein